MMERGDVQVSAAELRLVLYGLAEEFHTAIRNAANEILADTEDPDIYRAALKWKIDTAANIGLTAFSLDPLVAYYDMWVLAIQMTEYYETGPGRSQFGGYQGQVVAVSSDLEQRAETIFAGLIEGDDLERTRQRVREYAEANPLQGLTLARETASSEFARQLADSRASGFSAIGDMNQQFADVTERMKYLAAGLPSRFRWESELMLNDFVKKIEFEESMSDVTDIKEAALRIAVIGDDFERILNDQRIAMSEMMLVEMDAAFADIERQRLETMELITAERVAIMDAVVAERILVMGEFAALTDSAFAATPVIMNDAVDRLYDRLLILLLVALGGGAALVLLYRFIPQRVRSSRES